MLVITDPGLPVAADGLAQGAVMEWVSPGDAVVPVAVAGEWAAVQGI